MEKLSRKLDILDSLLSYRESCRREMGQSENLRRQEICWKLIRNEVGKTIEYRSVGRQDIRHCVLEGWW